MTTYIIYPDANDGYLWSYNSNYNTAVAGSNLTANTTDTVIRTGMNKTGVNHSVYQGFLSFPTSVINTAEELVDATITGNMGYKNNQTVWWDQQFRALNWTAPLTTAQWKSVASLKTYPVRASVNFMTPNSWYKNISTGGDSLLSNISKTADTKFIVVSSRHIAGNVPTGTEEIWINSANSTKKPYLTVHTTALNTLNTITGASTTLSDGTTVSLRSNGAASPTVTLGYNTLTSSTWTTIATISGSEFALTADGANSLTLTADKAGNIYVLGQRTNTPGTLAGKAYVRSTATTWAAKTTLYQALPTGNGQSIRSIAAVVMEAKKDSKDKPSIHIVCARGASGIDDAYKYHVTGAGFTHNAQLKPESLLVGSGNLIQAAAGYNPAASGVPAFVDMVSLSPSTNVSYVQRSKINGNVVGGISVISTYNQGGIFNAFNATYSDTGYSQLVPISNSLFAHVFDDAKTKLSVRIYNSKAQVVGTASLPRENFWGGVVGTQFDAFYDKTTNLVRVYYVDVSSARTLSRFDVSPITFSGTTTIGEAVNIGATGAVITALRISKTADERRILIECAVTTAGVLSTVAVYSTAGNIAPSGPALTTRTNYDAALPATFSWKFGDTNPKDTQTAYQIEISRVSDFRVDHDSGKVMSSTQSTIVPANKLDNPTDYRWRVRTYDSIGAVGDWSVFGTFGTTPAGTVTVIDPVSDSIEGIETSAYTVTWTYDQVEQATQVNRRVRLVRVSDGFVVSDTGMQATTLMTHTITGMESGKEYRIEVTVTNSRGVTAPTEVRIIAPYYSDPMTPQVSFNIGNSFIELMIDNPLPTGDRPEVILNEIWRRRNTLTSTEYDFVRIGTTANSGAYRDYSTKSGTIYDYKVVGQTTA